MKISTLSGVLVLLVLITSCASLRIPPPGPGTQTLLVLPARFSNPTHNKSYGFFYTYEIVSDPNEEVTVDTRVTPYRAVFKLPIKNRMLIVDSLPPGKYLVRSLVIQHIGTGTGTVNRKVIEINLKFGLEYGKVTILPKSLNITLSYKDPGRIDYINYRHRMEAVSAAQIDEILASLKKLENFDQWRLAGAGSSQ